MKFIGRFCTNPYRIHLSDFSILRPLEYRPVLGGNHSAAIIDCTFRQRISRIERSLYFHIDNKTNHILRSRIMHCCWRNRIKTNIIMYRSLSQRRILIIASSYYFRSPHQSVCIVNMNTNCANLWSSFDILFSNFIYGTLTVFIHTALHISNSYQT